MVRHPIGTDYFFHVKGVGEPSVSPDGKRIAYTLTWVDKETGEGRSRIRIARAPGWGDADFTQGETDSMPKWSPDGSTLAFKRKGKKGHPQVWVMPAGGGEARQLTSLPAQVHEYAWSPDSKKLAVVADVDPSSDDKTPKHLRSIVIRTITYQADGIGLRRDIYRHIFVVDVRSARARQVTVGDSDDGQPIWSPDSKTIAFVSSRSEERATRYCTEIYAVPAAGGDPELMSEGLYSVSAFAWSADGRRIVADATTRTGQYHSIAAGIQGWLFILEQGKRPRPITDDSISLPGAYRPWTSPAPIIWMGDGRILFVGNARGESAIYTAGAQGGEIKRVSPGGWAISQWTVEAAGKHAFAVASTPASPGDLYRADLTTGKAVRITSLNDGYFSAHTPARLEKFSFERAGAEIQCRVWLPPDLSPRKKYPVLLEVHGGPQAAHFDAFSPFHQVPATNGYVVLAVNPRGSGTYGLKFVNAVDGDWGGEDFRDLMAAVDLICKRPYVDSDRLFITGYSYGGFMSSWAVGHTDRFRAAVVGAPVVNLESMYGTSDIGVWFGEHSWGPRKFGVVPDRVIREQSPISYVDNVTTPVLLMHGEDDRRCPISESEQYFVALRRLGKEVEFVRFPGCSHGMFRSGPVKFRQEYLERMLGWFEKHGAKIAAP